MTTPCTELLDGDGWNHRATIAVADKVLKLCKTTEVTFFHRSIVIERDIHDGVIFLKEEKDKVLPCRMQRRGGGREPNTASHGVEEVPAKKADNTACMANMEA